MGLNGKLSGRSAAFLEFEKLENRQMLSQISVLSYGAVPNNGGDDQGAIQAAVNASNPGDTIFFPRGTYNISDEIRLKGGNRTYKGEDGTIIKGAESKPVLHVLENDTRIDTFTLDGRGVMMDQWAGQMLNNCVVNNCVMYIHGSGDNVNGVTFTTGLSNSSITNCRFENTPHMGIYGYYWNNLRIANNEFVNGFQGIHLDNINDQGQNLLIEQNYFSNIRRMGVEYQGGGRNTVVQDNYYENPNLSTIKSQNDDTFAFSLVADRSVGTIARRNTIIAPQRPDGWGVRLGFEAGGDNALFEQNYIIGTQYCISGNDYYGSSSVTVRDNHIENTLNGPFGRLASVSNNGPNVQLNWDINRGKPGRNRTFGTSTPTPPPPSQPPTGTPAPTPSGGTFLSNLNPTYSANAWGPYERDRSNAEQAAGDGRTITLNGTTYSKGLGMHAGAELRYNLVGMNATRFISDVGVDDEAGANGSVVFQVWADGVKLFDSGRMTGNSATQGVNVDITGKRELKLIVTDSGDSNTWDHADWGNARVDGTGTPTTPPPPAPTGTGTFLSSLSPTFAANAWGPYEKDHSNGETAANDGKTITLNGQTYAKGLGIHAGAELRYNLNGQYSTFQSDIGIDDEAGNNGSVVFQVWADGTKIFDSGTMTGSTATKNVNVNVAGKKELKLIVTDGGNGNTWDHADWANARVG